MSHFKYILLNFNFKLLFCRYPGVSEDPGTTKASQTKGWLRPPGSESHRAPGDHRQIGESLHIKQRPMRTLGLKKAKALEDTIKK